MTATEKKINIPELRFPEFEGEWDYYDLSGIAKIYDGTHQTPKYVDKGVKFVSVENIDDIDNTSKFITIEDFEKNFKIKPQKNDILMTRITAGIIGATAIVQNDLPLGYYVSLALIRKKNQVDAHYLNQRINCQLFKHELYKRIIHVAFPKKINLGDIGDCKISFPSLPEQQKIATFLTAVDKRINLLTQKKEKLEYYKKGVMQKLFSRELRFKPALSEVEGDENGNDYPEWEEKRLGEIGITYNGLSGKSKNDFGEGKAYIQYMQIFKKSNIDVSLCGLVKISQKENQNRVKYGDILFTTSSETPDEVGISSVLLEDIEEIYLNSFCFGFRPNSLDEIVPAFAQFLFRSENLRRKLIKLAQGSTRYNMSKNEFLKLIIHLPTNPEQQKIASFLSAIDKKIEQVARQIEHSNQWKKGLLQKMFI